MKIQAKAFLNMHDLLMLVENYNDVTEDRLPLPLPTSKMEIIVVNENGKPVQYVTFDADSDSPLQGVL